uniref:DUF2213 domain-containing protein n=1 Tax=Hafnia alvei TaxID=569 RepID=UPI0026F15092|nr:DUF2213 domain-containing protein [Hafnia alvei]
MIRYDTATIKAVFDDDGFLRDEPVVARIGIQEYVNHDGTIRRELRREEDVFDSVSLKSFAGKPLTVGHPGRVNSENAMKHTVGSVLGEGRRDGEYVRVPVVIYDKSAIDAAKLGKAVELSVGYQVEVEDESGTWNGKKYDAIQKSIKVNHVALVRRARAGSVARLNLDGDETIITEDETKTKEGNTMQKLRLDNGLEYDASPEVVVAFNALKQDAADKQTKLDEANTTISTITAERDTLKADAAEFETKLKQAREDAAVTIKARTELEAKAEKHGIKCDGLDDISVKKAVVAKLKPSIKLDGKDDTYINVAFDMAIESAPMEQQRKIVNQDKAETRDDASELKGSAAARQKYLDRLHGKKEAK